MEAEAGYKPRHKLWVQSREFFSFIVQHELLVLALRVHVLVLVLVSP